MRPSTTEVEKVARAARRAGEVSEVVSILDRECADDREFRRRVVAAIHAQAEAMDEADSGATSIVGTIDRECADDVEFRQRVLSLMREPTADPDRVQAVFLQAVEVTEPTRRVEILDRECGSDEHLRSRVVSLLHAHEHPAPELDRPAVADLTAEPMTNSVLGFLAPPTRPGSIGRLGHYEILEVLGRGGFGIVLKAFDDTLHRQVAIKMMSTEMAATSPARKRFLREARAAAAVRHENVVQIHGVEESPIPYLVMEYIPGKTLQDLLDENGPLETERVLQIGVQVARGLAAAHAMGLVHRDIKPANIMIEDGPDSRVKITDFGLARTADDASLTQSGQVAGTPMYMAPEQAHGEDVDGRTDLFSLGSVLYALASGRPPFRAHNSLAVLKRVTEDTPRPITEIIPESPVWLGDIIAKLHQKDPADRFQSAREVGEVLNDCLTQMQTGGRLSDATRIPVVKKRTVPRGRLALMGAGVAVLLGLVALALWQRGGKSAADFENALGMKFVRVAAGSFLDGGTGGEAGQRTTRIPADFYIGVYEVTQGEWEAVMGAARNPSRYSRRGDERAAVANMTDGQIARLPVDGVSWDQAQEFLRALNGWLKEPGWTYRLPTAMEWEYACRGGQRMNPATDPGADYFFDQSQIVVTKDQANFKESSLHRPKQVGSFRPNALGLYDMHGNVFELCSDVKTNDMGETLCTLIGGGWMDDAELLRAAHRGSGLTTAGYGGAGVRLVRVRE